MSFTNPHPASRLTLDATNSLSSGLVGFWPLTDGTGSTAKDISTGANDGTKTGAVWAATDIGAVFENAPTELGINAGTGGNGFTGGDFSASFWVYEQTQPSTSHFISTWGNGNVNGNFMVRRNVSTLQVYWSNGTSTQSTTASAPSSGVWSHICVTADATSLLIYKDGALVTTSSSPSLPSSQNSEPLMLGSSTATHTSTQSLDGYIQNVRTYTRKITATEVATLYHRPWEGTNYGDLWPYSPPAPADATLSTDTAATSLNVDLEGWWLCTDGSGTTLVDISGNSVNGTISGTVGWDTTALGTAIEPDGSSGRVDASVSLTGFPITTAAWFKTPSSAASNEVIISAADSTVGDNQLRLYVKTTGVLEANALASGGGGTATGTSTVDDDEWHFGVAVYESSTSRKLYVDGVLESTNTSTVSISACDRVTIGVTADSTPTAYFGGNIQNARVWSRALSADEITLLYERPFEGIEYGDAFHYDPPTPANLTPLDNSSGINTGQELWLPLTDGSGTTAVDISGGGNDGTLTNSPSWVSSSVGSAIKFTEANPNENVSLTSTLLGTTHTISFWASQYYDGNVLGGDGGPTGGDSKIYMSSSGLKYTADSWGGGTTSSPPAKSGMFHVCVVRNSTTTDWYVDGVFFQQTSFTSSTRQFELASIGGADISSWNGYSGTVQNVRIWTRALTADEVWSIYENPWLGSAYSDAAAVAFRYLINGFKNPLIGGGLVR